MADHGTIFLREIWPIRNPEDYKVHLGRRAGGIEPLDEWVRNRSNWCEWQKTRPNGGDVFSRDYIFSLMKFYHEEDIWLFGGIFRVTDRSGERYKVELKEDLSAFIGRLKLRSPSRTRQIRQTRTYLENHYEEFTVSEVLLEPYSGQRFPGYEDIDISFGELEALVQNSRPDWKAPLEKVKGVYLITDTRTGKRYVGSAYGDEGIWSRWVSYVNSGHGGNAELRQLVKDQGLSYPRANFRFVLLEYHAPRTSEEKVIERETFWKNALLTRGEYGLNRN